MNRLLHNGYLNGNGKLRYAASDWIGPEHGDRGGTFWTSRKTGERVYSPTNPGGAESQGQQDQPHGTVHPRTVDVQATAQKYAQLAREKWGDQSHAKLSEKAAALASDQSPEGQRKLAAVKAMMEAVDSSQTAGELPETPVQPDSVDAAHKIYQSLLKANDIGEIRTKFPDMVRNLSKDQVHELAAKIGYSPNKSSSKAKVAAMLQDNLEGLMVSRVRSGQISQMSADYDADEPLRYESPINLDDLRRMPGIEASAYAKGVLAMLARQPSLRREFSLQDLAYLEMIARDVDRYSADEKAVKKELLAEELMISDQEYNSLYNHLREEFDQISEGL